MCLALNCYSTDIDSIHSKGAPAPHDQLSPPVELQEDIQGYSPKIALLDHGAGRNLSSPRATKWLLTKLVSQFCIRVLLPDSFANTPCYPNRLSKNEEILCFNLHISDYE